MALMPSLPILVTEYHSQATSSDHDALGKWVIEWADPLATSRYDKILYKPPFFFVIQG